MTPPAAPVSPALSVTPRRARKRRRGGWSFVPRGGALERRLRALLDECAARDVAAALSPSSVVQTCVPRAGGGRTMDGAIADGSLHRRCVRRRLRCDAGDVRRGLDLDEGDTRGVGDRGLREREEAAEVVEDQMLSPQSVTPVKPEGLEILLAASQSQSQSQ